MDEILNKQEDSSYATPFNVDFFGPKSKNYFTEYTVRVLSLPESIKNILMDSSTAEFIEENLGSSFNLIPEQKTEITRIIKNVLLANLFIGEMAQSISIKANLSPNEAKRIKDSIISVLFKPAIEDIKKIQTDKFPEKVEEFTTSSKSQNPRTTGRADLKVGPDINRNNIVDLRNKQ